MVEPIVSSRVEESCEFASRFGDGPDVRSLKAVAIGAGERQIRFRRLTVVLLCNYVVYLASTERIRFAYHAILTS